MTLQQKIESYIRDIDATFGIYIKHLGTQEEVNIEGNRLFQMASVFKVPILATLYEKVYKGEIDLHERVKLLEEDFVPGSGVFQEMEYGIEPTIKDLATMMIIVSDNLATDKVMSIVGGANSVQEKMHQIGLNNIYIKHTCWELLSLSAGIPPQPYSLELFNEIIQRLIEGEYDWDSIVFQESTDNNVSSAKDMSLLLEKIALGEFVSTECSREIREILFKQHFQQRIGGLLPRNKKVANKTGSLGTMFNDAGIVYLPHNKGEFVITVYSTGGSLEYKGDEPIAHIAEIAYQYFMDCL
ncbi:serine hydrolase [Psychrobacillus vulpis]|uniref:Serine hydrolase n=1 Tax=Psychrobacillus vulpis TaxID=2325572 RepID=A0A544TUZ3_9BACI|nr:serine hydrolase [Psychrobacillus vulpis]TQR21250.1 serine hydrolase [Psychrobacillus vulpis]